VGSASNAVARLASARYELVLADVAMPDLNGYRLTRLIRKDEALRGLPVVLLGNRASAIDLARGALAGCSGYLVKPVTMQSLRLLVTRHLRRARVSP
jgi:CheY-like chemotaxis protein